MFTNVKAVLFDLDGTLIDSAPDLGAAANRMRIKRGLSVLPLDQYRPLAGAGARGMLSIGFGLTPDADNFNAMREEFFAEFERDLIANTVVFDQVDELIQTIEQRGYLWGVVTNKAERFTLPTTQQMPLFRNASCIVSGDTTPHAKPHPMPLLEAAKRAGALPEECIYVGDDERDIVAGLAAGMQTVAVQYGYLGANADTRSWGAQATIAQPLQLLSLLNLIFGALFACEKWHCFAKSRKLGRLGLHWFRRGFGSVVGRAEVQSPRKSAEKKLTANDERFALAA